jgi:hypothetical protein
MRSIFNRSGMILSFRAIFFWALAWLFCRFLQQKALLCVLDQKNSPEKDKEIRLIPVKI